MSWQTLRDEFVKSLTETADALRRVESEHDLVLVLDVMPNYAKLWRGRRAWARTFGAGDPPK